MHEYSVTEELLQLVLERAREAGAKRVVGAHLVVGELTGLVDESLRFYFEILSEGTEAEKATLSILRVPAKARCGHCENEFQPGPADWACPSCGGGLKEIVGGRELYLESIDID